jgi:hypothetical protein
MDLWACASDLCGFARRPPGTGWSPVKAPIIKYITIRADVDNNAREGQTRVRRKFHPFSDAPSFNGQ